MAFCISSSVRTMPTCDCIMSCRSYCTWYGPSASAPARSNGARASRATASIWYCAGFAWVCSLANSAA